jgi:hypothetical protein
MPLRACERSRRGAAAESSPLSVGFTGIAGTCAVCGGEQVPIRLTPMVELDGFTMTARCHGSVRRRFLPSDEWERMKRDGFPLPETAKWLRTLFADEAHPEVRLVIAYNRGQTMLEPERECR